MTVYLKRVCPECEGTGIISSPPPGGSDTCLVCDGAGYFQDELDVSDITDGIDDTKDKIDDKADDIISKLYALEVKIDSILDALS